MFGFFKKKNTFTVIAPTKGKLVELSKVKDRVFAQKMMGDGFAISPDTSTGLITVKAPVSGKIISLPSSKHAFGIHTEDGIDVLVHIGIDTVNLGGKGFESFAQEGDKIKQGQKVVQLDPRVLAESKIDDTIMVIFTSGYEKAIRLADRYGTEVSFSEKLIG